MTENRTLPISFSKSCFPPQSKEMLTHLLSQQSKPALIDKQNQLNKTIIPIKQYSNKYLTQKITSNRHPANRKLNTQQRFNLVLKKKNAISKSALKENILGWDQTWIDNSQAMIKINSINKPKRERNFKTEGSFVKQTLENNISQILTSSFYNLLPPTQTIKNNFFDDTPLQNKNRNRSVSIQNLEKQQKISQSRALEMYSKIFVRKKDQIFHKIQKKSYKYPQRQLCQTEQNFQTRQITPIQKSKKAKILVESCRSRRRSCLKYNTVESNNEQHEQKFELNGWQTTI